MQYLFVITYGRSGSTALLNLLNAIDGYTIRGENNGIASLLAKTVSQLKAVQAEPHAKAVNPSAPWYGILEPDADKWGAGLAQAFSDEFLRPQPDTRVLGFKEIRYTHQELTTEDYHQTIDFLADYFPNARFIFNTRAWSEVAESGWWRYYPNVLEVRKLVKSADQRFRASLDRLGDRAFLIDHADYKGNPDGFRPMLSWMNEEIADDVLEAVTRQKLNHMQPGYDDRGKVLKLRRMISWRLAGLPVRASVRRASGS